MVIKKAYCCNICDKEIKDFKNAVGVYFSRSGSFTIGNYGCTEDKHICARCLVQLKAQLAKIELPEFNTDAAK